MKWVILILGMLGLALGGLWLLQGLGLVFVPPILCVGDCTPLRGPSAPWAIAGLILAAGGLVAIRHAARRR
ncbi:MAG: hypothetical protein R3E44_16095 [Paracoccaceae bacterium]